MPLYSHQLCRMPLSSKCRSHILNFHVALCQERPPPIPLGPNAHERAAVTPTLSLSLGLLPTRRDQNGMSARAAAHRGACLHCHRPRRLSPVTAGTVTWHRGNCHLALVDCHHLTQRRLPPDSATDWHLTPHQLSSATDSADCHRTVTCHQQVR